MQQTSLQYGVYLRHAQRNISCPYLGTCVTHPKFTRVLRYWKCAALNCENIRLPHVWLQCTAPIFFSFTNSSLSQSSTSFISYSISDTHRFGRFISCFKVFFFLEIIWFFIRKFRIFIFHWIRYHRESESFVLSFLNVYQIYACLTIYLDASALETKALKSKLSRERIKRTRNCNIIGQNVRIHQTSSLITLQRNWFLFNIIIVSVHQSDMLVNVHEI